MMKLLDRILALVQARLLAARKVIADYEAAKAAQNTPAEPPMNGEG